MKPRTGALVGVALLIITAGAILLAIELVQRRRFAVLEVEIEGALAEFQTRAKYSREVDGILTEGAYRISKESSPPGTRARYWQLRPQLRDSLNNEVDTDLDALGIKLIQFRSFLLASPHISVFCFAPRPILVLNLLDGALKRRGLNYSTNEGYSQ